MKRMTAMLLILLLVLGAAGCGGQKNGPLLPQGEITAVEVSSLPEGYQFSFRGEDAQAVVDYLSGLTLKSDFEENPDYFTGMTWVISLEYARGKTVNVYHFGNLFIRCEDGEWYKMNSEEASRLEALLFEGSNIK